MHPTHPAPQAQEITVRHRTVASVMFIVCGALFLLLGVLALTGDGPAVWLILGPVILAAGIVSRFVPFIRFQPATATLIMHGPFGNRVRTFGAPKGERLYFDGSNIMRLKPDGKQKRVGTGSGEPADVQRLQQTLLGMQQH
ncbi:hypothetical protein [Glycomyces xiaoerkulensis]|uniref:hypothetical protein n=1 Tax=Glycomyces xiaoerkulensis TaxID=2038139 RepID=UPI000C266224|nr:hypothetical protein [Glycomyces xiaoerkulensis]